MIKNKKKVAKTVEDYGIKVAKTVEDYGMYFLIEDITPESAEGVMAFIAEKNLDTMFKPDHLQIMVSSVGGDVWSCFAIIDMMKSSKIPVYTFGLGVIASCGLLIFMSGEKGHRVLTPNTSILSHQISTGVSGKKHEIYSHLKEVDLVDKRILQHYKSCTGLSEKKIKELLLPESDVWLNAKEAKKYGICDNIKTFY